MTTSRRVALCAAAMLLPPGLGWAQNVGAESQIAEVVVTARKASESLQTTPVAVTALSGENLAKSQITQFSDLQKTAPALSTSTGGPGGPGVIYLAIRGQVNNSANSASDSAVAIYVDGVNIARPTAGNLGFLDAAQAEVLRGPQGTLFGRNTTGGALNVTSVQPTGEFGGYAMAEVGNYGSVLVEGAATLPLQGEELSLRVAGRFAQRDGYFENAFTGAELNDLRHNWAGRATVRWAPDDLPLTLTVAADVTDWADSGQATAVRAINSTLQPLGPAGPTIAQIFAANGLNPANYIYQKGVNFDKSYGAPASGFAAIDRPHDDGESAGLAATLEVELGSWNLKSISAWRKADSNNSLDLDGTPLKLVSFASEYRQDQYSEELTASTTFGNLDFIGGLFYFKEEGTEQSTSNAFGFLGLPLTRDHSDFDSTSKAIFAQANYRFTDDLRVTAGYRYTWDKRSIERHGLSNIATGACAPPIPLTPTGCADPFSAKFSYPAWTIGADYRVSDNVFVYVKSSNASMAGGFNTRPAPTGQQAFSPEETTDVEAGAKIDMFDRRLRVNIAVFKAETKDAQRVISGIVGGRLTQFVQNAGDVKLSGAEFEVTAVPWTGMEMRLGTSYLDSKYKAGTYIEERGILGGRVDRSGEAVPQAPEWTFNIGATQTLDTAYGELTLHADYAFIDEKVIGANTAAPGSSAAAFAAVAEANRLATLDSYSLVNARVALTLDNGVELSVWGRNLTDKEFFTFAFDGYNTLGFTSLNQGAPRTYGVGLRYEF